MSHAIRGLMRQGIFFCIFFPSLLHALPPWADVRRVEHFQLLRQLANRAEIASVWPGFFLSARALALHDTAGKAYVFLDHPCDMPEASTDRSLSHVCFFDDLLLPPGITTDTPIGRDHAVTMTWDQKYPTYIHEAFHTFQHEHNFILGQPLTLEHFQTPESMSLMEAEQEALAHALQAHTIKERVKKVADFITLRRFRYEILPPDEQRAEQALETLEGTARYVEQSSIAALFALRQEEALRLFSPEAAASKEQQQSALIAALLKPLDNHAISRGRYYETGAAISLLLDFRQASSWKERLSTGATLYEIFTKEFAGGGASMTVKQQYDIAQRTRRYAVWLTAEREYSDQQLVRFFAQPGVKLTLRLPYSLGGFSSSANSPLQLPNKQILNGVGSSVGKEDKTSDGTGVRFTLRGEILQSMFPGAFAFSMFLDDTPAGVQLSVANEDLSKLPLGSYKGKISLRHGSAMIEAPMAVVEVGERSIDIQLSEANK